MCIESDGSRDTRREKYAQFNMTGCGLLWTLKRLAERVLDPLYPEVEGLDKADRKAGATERGLMLVSKCFYSIMKGKCKVG